MASNTQPFERSEDDTLRDSPSTNKKRNSKACDQCRKTKTKCERLPPGAERCTSCVAANIECTYINPSYKRGPPKGYIHAIEQRWQQVESILGAIIACPDPGVQNIIASLKGDDLAREILTRVDAGPYGPSGKIQQPAVATKDDFFASILRSVSGRDHATDTRASRQSRLSREYVSSGEENLNLAAPTTEWQDRLISLLNPASHSPSYRMPSFAEQDIPSTPHSDLSGSRLAQRRRLERPQDPIVPPFPASGTSTGENEGGDLYDDTSEAIGQLTLDENNQVHFYGKTSGLYLLPRLGFGRPHEEGDIWWHPVTRGWMLERSHHSQYRTEDNININMPSSAVQDHLVELYFSYIHPHFPVIPKAQFLAEYRNHSAASRGELDPTTAPQELPPSKLLLLCIYSISCRFRQERNTAQGLSQALQSDLSFSDQVKDILSQKRHRSSATACQCLLLLGYRELGMGEMEQAWMLAGMAIRMAFDLGLNRNPDSWQRDGKHLFVEDFKQTRKQIWWACCLLDKMISVNMGRPPMIIDDHHNAPLPFVLEAEDQEALQPQTSEPSLSYVARPSYVPSTFNAACDLSVIQGAIISRVYPVRREATLSPVTHKKSLETALDRWRITLDDKLSYESLSERQMQRPHVLLLHMQYWATVLLLHRAFVPNYSLSGNLEAEADSESLKAIDLCLNAASHINSIVTTYQTNFGLSRCPPSMPSYILTAGIAHLLGMTVRVSDHQWASGLQQCLATLKQIELIWPNAAQASALLRSTLARFETESSSPTLEGKRRSDDFTPIRHTGGTSFTSTVYSAGGTMQQGVRAEPETGTMPIGGMFAENAAATGYPPSNPSYDPSYNVWARARQQLSTETSIQREGMGVYPEEHDLTSGDTAVQSYGVDPYGRDL